MLLIASSCIIADALLDSEKVDTRQGRLQALDATLARGSKAGVGLTALLPLDETSVRGTREAWRDV